MKNRKEKLAALIPEIQKKNPKASFEELPLSESY